MAKAIKVKEASFNEAKKALEQAKITHSYVGRPKFVLSFATKML